MTLWDLASGRPIRTFEAGPDPVEALAFSGDGRRLAAGGGHGAEAPGWVTAWDAETGAVLGTLDRVGLVMSLAFHPDGSRLAVADYEETKVHLWDLADGHADHPSGAEGRQLRRVHPGREAAGVAGLRRQCPPGRRPDRRRGAGAPHLRPARRRRRLHAPDGLQPRRFPDRRQRNRLCPEPLGPRAERRAWRSNPKPATSRAGCAAAAPWPSGATSRPPRPPRARPRDHGRRRVPLDRARRVALSPRRLCTGTGRPGTGHGGPARRPRAMGRPRPAAQRVSAGRRSRRRSWRRPGPSASGGCLRAPTTRRPPRPWPSCSRRPTPRRAGPSSGPT